MSSRLRVGGRGGRGYSRWWKQHEQQGDGDLDPAAAGASFVWCVEDGRGCLVAGLGGVSELGFWLPFFSKDLDSF